MVPTGDVENIVNTIELKDVVGTHSHDSQERKFYLIKYTFCFPTSIIPSGEEPSHDVCICFLFRRLKT